MTTWETLDIPDPPQREPTERQQRFERMQRDGCCGKIEEAHAHGGWCYGCGMCPLLKDAAECLKREERERGRA